MGSIVVYKLDAAGSAYSLDLVTDDGGSQAKIDARRDKRKTGMTDAGERLKLNLQAAGGGGAPSAIDYLVAYHKTLRELIRANAGTGEEDKWIYQVQFEAFVGGANRYRILRDIAKVPLVFRLCTWDGTNLTPTGSLRVNPQQDMGKGEHFEMTTVIPRRGGSQFDYTSGILQDLGAANTTENKHMMLANLSFSRCL